MESLDSLKPICELIDKCLSEKISDSPDEVVGKIGELKNLLGTSSHAVALSEVLYNKKITELMQAAEYRNFNTTEKKMIFLGLAQDEVYYMTLCERHNKALVHSIEGLRSVLSYLKSEMSLLPSH